MATTSSSSTSHKRKSSQLNVEQDVKRSHPVASAAVSSDVESKSDVKVKTKKSKTEKKKRPLFTAHFTSLRSISCSMCKSVLGPWNVKTCDNGHPVCKSCLDDAEEEAPEDDYARCPECESPEFDVNNALTDVINALRLPCVNKKEGCKQWMSAERYEDHALECKFTPLPCPISPNYCKWKMDRGMSIEMIKEHLYTHERDAVAPTKSVKSTASEDDDYSNSHSDSDSDSDSESVGVTGIHVTEVPEIELNKETPCLLVPNDTIYDRYYIVPVRKSDTELVHVLVFLHVGTDTPSTVISSLVLPDEKGNVPNLVCKFNFGSSSTTSQATLSSSAKEIKKYQSAGDNVDCYFEGRSIINMTVTPGHLKSKEGLQLDCLLKAQRGQEHKTCPGGWMFNDPVLDMWPDSLKLSEPSDTRECIMCTGEYGTGSAYSAPFADAYAICNRHLTQMSLSSRDLDKTKSPMQDALIGTLMGINILKTHYAACTDAAYVKAVQDAHRLLMFIFDEVACRPA